MCTRREEDADDIDWDHNREMMREDCRVQS